MIIRVLIDLSKNGSDPSDYRHFRTTWQTVKDGKRFLIIPYRNDDEQKTNAKLELPIIYLSLSRLLPIGEAKGEGIKKNTIEIVSLAELTAIDYDELSSKMEKPLDFILS